MRSERPRRLTPRHRHGDSRLADLPAGVSWSAFAARLEAHIATLAGVYRLSRRQVREVCQEVFNVPISVGAVSPS
jgi:transposase